MHAYNVDRPEAYKNIREASKANEVGLTALINGEPFLILGQQGNEYLLEGEEGVRVAISVDTALDVAPKSANNALVAASRLEAPFKVGSVIGDWAIGNLVFHEGNWLIRRANSTTVVPLETFVNILENENWEKEAFSASFRVVATSELKWLRLMDGTFLIEDPEQPVSNHFNLVAQQLGEDALAEMFNTTEPIGIQGTVQDNGRIYVGGLIQPDMSQPVAPKYNPETMSGGRVMRAVTKQLAEALRERGIEAEPGYGFHRMDKDQGGLVEDWKGWNPQAVEPVPRWAGWQKGSPYPGHHDEDKSHDKEHMKGAPDKVNEIYHAIRRDNPDISKEQAARMAWSQYKKGAYPNSPAPLSQPGLVPSAQPNACPECGQLLDQMGVCRNCGWTQGATNPNQQVRDINQMILTHDTPAEHFLDTMGIEAARSDYDHWNEDADYMWWEEEGKHPEGPPEEDFESSRDALDEALEEGYQAAYEDINLAEFTSPYTSSEGTDAFLQGFIEGRRDSGGLVPTEEEINIFLQGNVPELDRFTAVGWTTEAAPAGVTGIPGGPGLAEDIPYQETVEEEVVHAYDDGDVLLGDGTTTFDPDKAYAWLISQQEFDKAQKVKTLIDRTPQGTPSPSAEMPQDFQPPAQEMPPPPTPEVAQERMLGSVDKEARKNYSLKEQTELVNENPDGKARNWEKLNLTGTHYEQVLEASLEDFLWI